MSQNLPIREVGLGARGASRTSSGDDRPRPVAAAVGHEHDADVLRPIAHEGDRPSHLLRGARHAQALGRERTQAVEVAVSRYGGPPAMRCPVPFRRLHGPTQAVRVAPSGKKVAGGIAVVRNLRGLPDEERQPLAEPCNLVCYHVDKPPAAEVRACGSPGQAAR